MLIDSLIRVYFINEKSTLFVGSTRRFPNLNGNVRRLFASWNDESLLNPVGLARGVPGQVVALNEFLQGSLKLTQIGGPLESPLVVWTLPLLSRRATNPVVSNHWAIDC